jgi:hypothetical protein
MEVGGDSFENLCAYLGLPNTYHELVSSSVVFDLSVKWAKHKKVRITFVLLKGSYHTTKMYVCSLDIRQG